MTHPRAAIREAFLQRLKTKGDDEKFPTVARDRVHKSRLAPIDTDDDRELPAILIYVREEKRKLESYGPDAEDSYVKPDLTIVVEGIVRAKDNVDDRLDALAGEIEAALEDWEIPGFEAATVRLGDTDIDVIAEGNRKPVGAIGLVWHVSYMRPWRTRPAGMRPNTVNVSVSGGQPERLITEDRGIYQADTSDVFDEDAFLSGLPHFVVRKK